MTTKKLKKPDRRKPDRKVSDVDRWIPSPSTLREIVQREVELEVRKEIKKVVKSLLKEGIRKKSPAERMWKEIEDARKWWRDAPKKDREKLAREIKEDMKKDAGETPIPSF